MMVEEQLGEALETRLRDKICMGLLFHATSVKGTTEGGLRGR